MVNNPFGLDLLVAVIQKRITVLYIYMYKKRNIRGKNTTKQLIQIRFS